MAPYVTNITLSDGFGSQFQHIISVLLICYRSGFFFAYNSLKTMAHNYNDDPDFLEKMEDLMNIRPHFISKDDESLKDEHITVCDMTAKYVIDKNVNEYATDDSLGQIKTMFWANKCKADVFAAYPNRINVAVHVRRANSHDVRVEGTDTSDDFFLRAIQRVRDEHNTNDSRLRPSSFSLSSKNESFSTHAPFFNPENIQNSHIKPLLFHIYSQGPMEKFSCYLAEDTVLHIDEDLAPSFLAMVASDILVTSFSSLSYIAAFLNDGVVYYHPFWHPPRQKWIILK